MSVSTGYEEPRAHAVRERYLGLFGGPELPVPVEAITGDLLGLRIEESWDSDCSGMLLPKERRIVLNAHERATGRDDPPLPRFRFTVPTRSATGSGTASPGARRSSSLPIVAPSISRTPPTARSSARRTSSRRSC